MVNRSHLWTTTGMFGFCLIAQYKRILCYFHAWVALQSKSVYQNGVLTSINVCAILFTVFKLCIG